MRPTRSRIGRLSWTPPSRRAALIGTALVLGAGLIALSTRSSLGSYSVKVANKTNTAVTAVWASTCLDQAKADSTYLFWRLDEASGPTAADASGSGLPATYRASGVSYRATAGPCVNDTQSKVITLDGASGYLYGPRVASVPTSLSEELWFKTTTTTGGKLIGLGNSQTGASTQYDRHVYMTNEGRLVFGTYSGGYQTITSSGIYRDGQWHHVVATLAPSGANKGSTLYVDGKVVASNAAYTSGESVSNSYVRVGYDALSASWAGSPTSDFFKGSLADVALYPSALTLDQVKAHYDSGS